MTKLRWPLLAIALWVLSLVGCAARQASVVEASPQPDGREVRAGSASDAEVPPPVVAAIPPTPAKKISLDLRDAEIRDVLRMIAEVGDVSIVASDDVKGTVTVRLHDTPWHDAFARIVASLNLAWERDGALIRVSTPERLHQEQQRALELKTTAKDLAPLVTEYVDLRYAHAAKLAEQISGRASAGGEAGGRVGLLSDRGTIVADPLTNTLVVRDVAESVTNVRAVIDRLDVAAPQVLIESRIVEASADISQSLGIQWGYRGAPGQGDGGVSLQGGDAIGAAPFIVDFPADVVPGAGGALGLAIGSVDAARAFELRLTAMEREGKARIISRPRVVTLNNMAATIKSLTVIRVKLPSTETVVNTGSGNTGGGSAATERIETGIILVVTPQVAANGQVILELFAKSSQADFSRAVDGIPTETSREASAHVRVADGETVVLGGIYTDRNDDRETGIPFLRDVPVLGWLFKRSDRSDRREDLLVFLTPHVVAPEMGLGRQVAEAAGRELQPVR